MKVKWTRCLLIYRSDARQTFVHLCVTMGTVRVSPKMNRAKLAHRGERQRGAGILYKLYQQIKYRGIWHCRQTICVSALLALAVCRARDEIGKW